MTAKPKIVKRADILVLVKDQKFEDTMRRHELAMLKLLVSKHPVKAREYLGAPDRKVVDMREE